MSFAEPLSNNFVLCGGITILRDIEHLLFNNITLHDAFVRLLAFFKDLTLLDNNEVANNRRQRFLKQRSISSTHPPSMSLLLVAGAQFPDHLVLRNTTLTVTAQASTTSLRIEATL